jgi:Ca2+-binding EF-hand superfamily protein
MANIYGPVFKALDTDNSGFIDFNELYLGMSKLYPHLQLTQADVLQMLREADTDYDGQISLQVNVA